MSSSVSRRKVEHLEICATEDVEHRSSMLLEQVHLFHEALPELVLLAFGVGSQRAMWTDPEAAYTSRVRDSAPDAVLLGATPPRALIDVPRQLGPDLRRWIDGA